jgi:hypothetical protein
LLKDWSVGGPECGSFAGGGNTYREFIIGNEAMIEEYSFGTETILARLQDDIARLEQFFERVRPCPELRAPADWNLSVGCQWPGEGALDEMTAYVAALAMPSPGYVPASAPLAALIDTLEGDLFTPDPFVVRPEPRARFSMTAARLVCRRASASAAAAIATARLRA